MEKPTIQFTIGKEAIEAYIQQKSEDSTPQLCSESVSITESGHRFAEAMQERLRREVHVDLVTIEVTYSELGTSVDVQPPELAHDPSSVRKVQRVINRASEIASAVAHDTQAWMVERDPASFWNEKDHQWFAWERWYIEQRNPEFDVHCEPCDMETMTEYLIIERIINEALHEAHINREDVTVEIH